MDTKKERLKTEMGILVKYLREKQDLRQEDLADETGLSLSAISKMEQGMYDIKLSNLFKLSEGLKIDPGLIVSVLNDFNKGKITRTVAALQRRNKK